MKQNNMIRKKEIEKKKENSKEKIDSSAVKSTTEIKIV